MKNTGTSDLGALLRNQLLLLLLSLVAVELALQLLAGSSLRIKRLLAEPWEVQMPIVADEQMLARGNPLHVDADSWGYRNATRPHVAHIVTLGDSHTWGPEDPRDSWPSLLQKLTGHTVYNMALPAYGPLHSLLQLDQALSLSPKLIIVAPYFGNDFYDSFLLVQRHPELATDVSQTLLNDAIRIERQRPIAADAGALFVAGESLTAPREVVGSVRRFVSKNIRLYGLLRAIRYQVQPRDVSPLLSRRFELAAAALTPELRRYASVVDGPEWKTVLTAPHRAVGLDERDPRIRVGFDLARYAVREIAGRCRAAGVDFLVVLMPTKESVFFPRVRMPSSHPRLEELVANEARLKAEWISELESLGIPYIDGMIPLRQAAVQPYTEDVDGHPNREGHLIIAKEIARRIAIVNN